MTENATNYSIPNNYVESATGENLINVTTGEVRKAIPAKIPDGGRVQTPEELAAIERKKEAEQRRRAKRMTSNFLGNFYFVPVTEEFQTVTPQTATRLLFLFTYLEPNGKRLMHEKTRKNKHPRQIKREDLVELMHLKPATICGFLKEVVPTYITIDEEGYLFSNSFFRGETKDKTKQDYQQFYIQKTRELYRAVKPKQHKQLGYIFRMLPYVNYEYNILCMNPDEIEFDKIEPLNISELCELSDYSTENEHKLMKAYDQITFDVDGMKQVFCAIVNRDRIVINPRIFYRGHNPQQAYDAIYNKI